MRLLARIAATVVLLVFIPVTASAAAISDVEPAAAAEAGFEDVPADHLFSDAVSWLADQGITKGCNPPANTRFCPDDKVTASGHPQIVVGTRVMGAGG